MSELTVGTVQHYRILTTSPDTGLQADADSPPTINVYQDGSNTPAATVVSTRLATGTYDVAVTYSGTGFSAGHSYNAIVSAVFGSDTFNSIRDTVSLVAASTPQTADVAATLTALATLSTAVLTALTNLSTRIPGALVNSRMDVNVGAMQNGVISAPVFAANAIDDVVLATAAVTEIVTGVRNMQVETEGTYTLQQVLSELLSVLCGIVADNGDTFKTPNGNATRAAFQTDDDANRTSVTLTPSG